MTDAVATEHILLESELPEPDCVAECARTVRLHVRLNDPIRQARTDLTVYEEGYLGVREHRGREPRRDFLVDLRYLDSKPALSRSTANAALRAALGWTAFALLTGVLTRFSALPGIALPVAVASLIAAGVAALIYLYRTQERVQFVTRHGRAVAVVLRAGFGSFGPCRALVPQLVRTIAEVQRGARGDQADLRREIREHYRLRESGAITREECITAVQRILERFH